MSMASHVLSSSSSNDFDDQIQNDRRKRSNGYGSWIDAVDQSHNKFSYDTRDSPNSFLSVAAASSSSSSSTSLVTRGNSIHDSDFPALPPIMMPVVGGRHIGMPTENPDSIELSELEMMKKRFAKLLLGEDMSGGRKGVCTALAISNAITNLSATVFGELWKLEPLTQHKKSMWLREMEWLLCVSDSIVELIPSVQQFPNGGSFEVMATQQRSDLQANLPALRKLDAMLIGMLDSLHDSEFYYVERGIVVAGGEHLETHPPCSSSGRPSIMLEEKWWLPFPKVPSNGLCKDTRKKLQQYRECTSQIFKAAVAINASVLSEMDIPNAYLDSLPKCGKDCLGRILYRYIAEEQFLPERILEYVDLSSEHTALQIANRIEGAIYIWRQKYYRKQLSRSKSTRSSWGGTVRGLSVVADSEKTKLLAERAEVLSRILKSQFPCLPQTTLDIHKIQYNRDVGLSILESYSRVLESLAFNLLARIDDLLLVDDAAKRRAAAVSRFGQKAPATICSTNQMVRSPNKTQKWANKSIAMDEPQDRNLRILSNTQKQVSHKPFPLQLNPSSSLSPVSPFRTSKQIVGSGISKSTNRLMTKSSLCGA